MKECLIFLGFLIILWSCDPQGEVISQDKIDQVEVAPRKTKSINPYEGFIKFYEGKIGPELSIKMKLINWGEGGLSGSYQYEGEKQKLDLEGDLETDLRLVIDEFIDYDQTGTFVGQLTSNNQITGKWTSADTSQSFDFTLRERIEPKAALEWEGVWHRNKLYSPGTLIIGDSDSTSFAFALSVSNNGHSGEIDGRAKITNGIAHFESNEYAQDVPCQLKFTLLDDAIDLSQMGPNFSCGFGMRAHAGGLFEDQQIDPKAALDFGKEESVFTSHDILKKFIALVGEDTYEKIAFNLQVLDKQESIDESTQIKQTIIKGGIPGLYTSNEAIIIYDNMGKIWTATIDFRNGSEAIVRYFTNDLSTKTILPPAIESWRERFQDYIVVFESSAL